MSVVGDIALSIGKLSWSVVYDSLGASNRCIILLEQALRQLGVDIAMLRAFSDGGIMIGAIGTFTTAMVMTSIATLTRGTSFMERLMQLLTIPFIVDALLQWISFFVTKPHPYGSTNTMDRLVDQTRWTGSYPCSTTGFVSLGFQIPVCVLLGFPGCLGFPDAVVIKWFSKNIVIRYIQASLGLCLYRSSVFLALEELPCGSWLCFITSIVPLVSAIIPQGFASELHNMVFWVGDKLGYLLHVYLVPMWYHLWPRVQSTLWRFWSSLHHPVILFLHRIAIKPIWKHFSPFVLPLTTGAYLVVDYSSICETLAEGVDGHTMVLLAGQAVCLVAAACSTSILLGHGVSRAFIGQIDPLRHSLVCKTLSAFAWLIASLYNITVWLFQSPFICRILGFYVEKCLDACFSFAKKDPILTITSVLALNGGGLYFIHSSDLGAYSFECMYGVKNATLAVLLGFAKNMVRLQTTPLDRALDSTIAIMVIAFSQMLVYAVVGSLLPRVPKSGPQSSSEMTRVELNSIAEGMEDPRQCAMCFFGPVDYDGCDNLVSHHLQNTGAGILISNACPACGWMAQRLSQWPFWESSTHTDASLAVIRMRVWGEIVLAVRAGAKALVIPFGILRVGGECEIWSSLVACVALTYLLPWLFENWNMKNTIHRTEAYNYLRRRSGRGGRPAPNVGRDDADCGASNLPAQLGTIAPSDALAFVLAAQPEKVFLRAGDPCCVCLEEFPIEAVQAVQGMTNEDAVAALRHLTPPMVALRCGHPLHVECAERSVHGADGRHVRCPLCREPVSLAGALSARCFN